MLNRLICTARMYYVEVKIDQSEAMREFRRNASLQIKVGNRELNKLIILNKSTYEMFY